MDIFALWCVVFSQALFGIALAAERLAIGDTAPAIDVEHWISDRPPVAEFEPGKVYVIEFWATWCGPCVASIPHLRDLQEKHGDAITVVSVSDEPLTTIEPFLEREHEGVTFREITKAYWLATDPDGSVKESYMRAAGQNGIPTAFIVGKTGHIEWIGHPMRIDEPVMKILAGTWDRAAYQREMAEQAAFMEKLRDATKLAGRKDFSGATAAIDALIVATTPEDLRRRAELAKRQIQAQAAKSAAEQGGGQGGVQGAVTDIRQLAIGDRVTIRVTGRTGGPVRGDAVYAIDSDVASAAVHAGLVTVGETKTLRVWVVPAPGSFPAAERNGVPSAARDRAPAAYFLEPADSASVMTGGGVTRPLPRRRPPEIENHPEQQASSRRWYERELQEIGANPGPVAPSGKGVGPEDPLDVDQTLLVQYGTTWWGARVVHLFPDGRVWVRYLGWSPVSDEVVKRDRLQFDDAAVEKAREAVVSRRATDSQ